MMPTHQLVRHKLADRLEELNARVERIEAEQRRPMEHDSMEQVVERENDEVLDGVERSALAAIAAIRQALSRLDSGTYGLCIWCGEAIAPARLEAMPTASQCIRCAGKVARDNG
jgi:DnaK suppressor protein